MSKRKARSSQKNAPLWLTLTLCVAAVAYVRNCYRSKDTPMHETHQKGESADTSYPEGGQEYSIKYSTLGDVQDEIIRGDTTLMELPRLSGGNRNYYVTHYASGVVNYSIEYDIELRHPRWVAFIFDRYTSPEVAGGRSNSWCWDPDVPAAYSTDNWYRGSGFSRGHMVASSDRQYSVEANQQTFYYTNVSPQRQEHNAGVWSKLEQRVQKWGRNRAFCDTLFVAKGGTIVEGQVERERIRGTIPVPKYYWMALLMKKNGEYHSIAFLCEHRSYGKTEGRLQQLAVSVAKLEALIGIELFHHLPAGLSEQVKREEPLSKVSRQIWWSY